MQEQIEFVKKELPKITVKLIDFIINGSFVDNQYMVYDKDDSKSLPNCYLCSAEELTNNHLFMSDKLGELINFKLKSFKLANLHTLLVLSCTHINYHPITEFICENIESLYIKINKPDPYYKISALQVAAECNNIQALLSLISLESLDYTFKSLNNTFNLYNPYLMVNLHDQIIIQFKNLAAQTQTEELVAKADELESILNKTLIITKIDINLANKDIDVNLTNKDNETNNQTQRFENIADLVAATNKHYALAIKLLTEINGMCLKKLGILRCMEKLCEKSEHTSKCKNFIIKTYDDLKFELQKNMKFTQDQIDKWQEEISQEELQIKNEFYGEQPQDNLQFIPINNLKDNINQLVISETMQDANNINNKQLDVKNIHKKSDIFIKNNKLKNHEMSQINKQKLYQINNLQKSITILTDLLNHPGKSNSIEFGRALRYAQKGAFNINQSKKSNMKQSFVIKVGEQPIGSYHESHNYKGINQKIIRTVQQNVAKHLLEESKNNNQILFFGVNNNKTIKFDGHEQEQLKHDGKKSNFKK